MGREGGAERERERSSNSAACSIHCTTRLLTPLPLSPSLSLLCPYQSLSPSQVSLVRKLLCSRDDDDWKPSLDYRVGSALDEHGVTLVYEAFRLPQGHTCTSSLHLPVYASAGRTRGALVHPALKEQTRFDMD